MNMHFALAIFELCQFMNIWKYVSFQNTWVSVLSTLVCHKETENTVLRKPESWTGHVTLPLSCYAWYYIIHAHDGTVTATILMDHVLFKLCIPSVVHTWCQLEVTVLWYVTTENCQGYSVCIGHPGTNIHNRWCKDPILKLLCGCKVSPMYTVHLIKFSIYLKRDPKLRKSVFETTS